MILYHLNKNFLWVVHQAEVRKLFCKNQSIRNSLLILSQVPIPRGSIYQFYMLSQSLKMFNL